MLSSSFVRRLQPVPPLAVAAEALDRRDAAIPADPAATNIPPCSLRRLCNILPKLTSRARSSRQSPPPPPPLAITARPTSSSILGRRDDDGGDDDRLRPRRMSLSTMRSSEAAIPRDATVIPREAAVPREAAIPAVPVPPIVVVGDGGVAIVVPCFASFIFERQ